VSEAAKLRITDLDSLRANRLLGSVLEEHAVEHQIAARSRSIEQPSLEPGKIGRFDRHA